MFHKKTVFFFHLINPLWTKPIVQPRWRFFNVELNSNLIIWLGQRAGKMNQILHCDWLPEQAKCSYLARLRLPTMSSKKNFPRKPYNKSFIDQACSVKMAGYWHCSFFAGLRTLTPSRYINTQKKEFSQYPAILTSH